MALPVTIPNEFASATASIPLSQLDTNFTTLADAVNGISDGSETLANASVTVITAGTANVTTLNTSGQVVFNDAGADVDFRVEGDTDANLLFVDASTDRVGVGTNAPDRKLDVTGTGRITGEMLFGNDVVLTGDAYVYSSNGGGGVRAGLFLDGTNQLVSIRTAATERMRIDSSGNLLFNSGFGSAGTAYGCRAWVNFDGTGTPAIRGSGNVSSITDVSTGTYTVNFTSAMPDVNYSAVTGYDQQGSGPERLGNCIIDFANTTVSGVRVRFLEPGVATYDISLINVAVFR